MSTPPTPAPTPAPAPTPTPPPATGTPLLSPARTLATAARQEPTR
ncbi:hypothetical protein ABZ622_32145 [Streptomyces sp. NPDC007164]